MGKISSVYTIGKTYIKRFFASFEKSVEKTVSINEQIAEPQKVYSKQIEAYYKRYGKALEKKQKPEKQTKTEPLKNQVKSPVEELQLKLQEEVDAYNERRFVIVSEEALMGLKHNFEEKKKKVIELILANSNELSSQYISMVKRIKTPEELSFVLRTYSMEYNRGLNIKYKKEINELLKGKNISLKTQQKIFNDEVKLCDIQVELIKMVTEPSIDKRVIQIENFLKEMYGMNYVHLESIEEAKQILKTIKISQKQKIPLPKNIIITPYTAIQTAGVNYVHSATEYTVIISSFKERQKAMSESYKKLVSPELNDLKNQLKKQDENLFSTKDLLHLYLHEFTHSDQALELLFSFKNKRIPAKFKDVVLNMNDYARTSRRELYSELRTKYILDSLNQDEKALLYYFS